MRTSGVVLILCTLQPAHRVFLGSSYVLLETEKLLDISDVVQKRCPSLYTDAPSYDGHILRESHWQKHLWSEDAAVSNLNPLLQDRVVAKDFHRRFGVWVVGRFEAKTTNTHSRKELLEYTNQVAKANVPVSHKAFHLVEFSKVRGIEGLISEHSIYGEALFGLKYTSLLVL